MLFRLSIVLRTAFGSAARPDRSGLAIALGALAALAACQGQSSKGTPAPVAPPSIELHDAKGKVTARITPGRPCRATVDDIELLIGTEPLVAQIGEARWTGTDDTNGTTFKRNDETVARMAPSDRPDEAALFTPDGVAIVRATLAGDSAKLVSGAGAIIGTAAKTAKGITVADHYTVTGTDDVLLAALLSAQDAPPEVRGLAACRRLFPPTMSTEQKATP